MWIVVDTLRALLPHIEHHYHTSEDATGMWWQLVLAIRTVVAAPEYSTKSWYVSTHYNHSKD